MEPASQQLIRRLDRLGLNSQRDLQDCRAIVRRLARDLPTFDSVWIDALVQRRRLTPFQARLLESNDDGILRIGPVVLQHPLEPGEHCRTYLASHLRKSEPCVIKLLNDHELPHNVFDQLEQLASRLRSAAQSSMIGPHACLRDEGRIITVSRNAKGRTVHELMVRRGRFSPPIVAEIGRQLVGGLAALEARSIYHGDIAMVNLRLNDRGAATLVDAGVRPIIESNPDLHTELPLRRMEGLAPERIGTGQPANSNSDMYGLGCLLWRLLCGRPIFLTADPLALIAAHRSKDIVDVREWSPETPAWLADFILESTRREPTSRPQGFAAVAKHWGKPRRSGKRQLQRFHASFDRVPAQAKTRGRLVPFAAAGILLATAATVVDFDQLPQLLSLSHYAGTGTVDVSTDTAAGLLPSTPADPRRPAIPQPDSGGRIVLEDGTEYSAANLTFAGHLALECEGRATIIVDDQSMQLAAAEISIQGVHFVDRRANSDRTPTLRLQSQSASIRSSSYQTAHRKTRHEQTAISWQSDDRSDRSGGRISLNDCVFWGHAAAIEFIDSPTIVVCENSLKAGRGPLMKFVGLPQVGYECQLTVRNSTLRESGALLQLWPDGSGRYGLISVRQSNCVFAIRTGRSLVETYAETINSDQPLVQVGPERSAETSLLKTGIRDAAWLNPMSHSIESMPPGTIRVSGLVTTDLEFAQANSVPENCLVTGFEAPRRSELVPGIDASRLAVR
jgi:serine/threonine protein kinase